MYDRTTLRPPGRPVPAIVTTAPVSPLCLPWRRGAREHLLSVVVKVTCELVPGEAARVIAPDLPQGDVHADPENLSSSLLYPTDLAPFKPRVDVVVRGTAHPPSRGATASRVMFHFGAGKGGVSRAVAVFGARRWQGAAGVVTGMSAPARLEPTPLTYELAFGGPGYGANPTGVGLGGGDLLPCFEDPDALLRSPGDRPPPAGLGAIPMLWPERWSRLGSFDDSYLKDSWPGLPADFDAAFFQAAPREQQLDAVRGDEAFELAGLLPGGEVLRGRLPGVAPRAYAQRSEAAGGGFGAVGLRLDTVVFDTDAARLWLVWRGLLEVASARALEVDALFVELAPRGEPERTLEQAREQMRAQVAAEGDPVELGGPANEVRPPDPETEALRARLVEAGVPGAWMRDDLTLALDGPAPADVEHALLGPAGGDDGMRAALALLRDQAELARAGRALVEERLAAGASLEGLSLPFADLSGLVLAGRSLAGADLRRADLRLADLGGCDLRGALLAEADATDANLQRALLGGADLTLARLPGARLDGAVLDETDLSRVDATGARFAGTEGSFPIFAGAALARADFSGARLTRAELTRAQLDGATFEGATLLQLTLYHARGDKVRFTGADLTDARADHVRLSASNLEGVVAPGSIWDDASLDGCSLRRARLQKASFARTMLRRASLAGADLREAVAREADLSAADVRNADLMKASLEGAKLAGTDLRGASLYRADATDADFTATRLDGANVDGALLGRPA